MFLLAISGDGSKLEWSLNQVSKQVWGESPLLRNYREFFPGTLGTCFLPSRSLNWGSCWWFKKTNKTKNLTLTTHYIKTSFLWLISLKAAKRQYQLSFQKYFYCRAYCVPSAVLGTGDILVAVRTKKFLLSCNL